MDGGFQLLFEALDFGFVLFHVDAPAGQATGQAGVVTFSADGEREIFRVDQSADTAIGFVDFDLTQFGGFEGFDDQFMNIGGPAEKIDLFVVELSHNIFHAGTANADAGADGIDFFHVRPNGDLRAETGFTGEGFNLHRAIVQLIDFEGEETAHEVRTGTGENDFGSTLTRLDGENESPDAFPGGVLFRRNAFAGGHDAFKLTQIDDNVGPLEAANSAGDDIAHATLELFHDHGFLDRAQVLVHGLLEDLGGDSAELAGIEFDLDEFTDVRVWFDGPGFDDGDFVRVGTGPVAGLEFGEHLDLARFLVEVDADFSLERVGLVGGGNQGILDHRAHHLAAYALLLFHVIEYCEEVLCVHVLIFFGFWRPLLAKKRVETFEFPPNIRRETTPLKSYQNP